MKWKNPQHLNIYFLSPTVLELNVSSHVVEKFFYSSLNKPCFHCWRTVRRNGSLITDQITDNKRSLYAKRRCLGNWQRLAIKESQQCNAEGGGTVETLRNNTRGIDERKEIESISFTRPFTLKVDCLRSGGVSVCAPSLSWFLFQFTASIQIEYVQLNSFIFFYYIP